MGKIRLLAAHTGHRLSTAALQVLAACLMAATTSAHGQAPAPASRGQLLYETYCVACHDKQMHWRATRSATDWKSLVAQVRRWQEIEKLRWSDDDVIQVARYLNDQFYRYPAASLAQQN